MISIHTDETSKWKSYNNNNDFKEKRNIIKQTMMFEVSIVGRLVLGSISPKNLGKEPQEPQAVVERTWSGVSENIAIIKVFIKFHVLWLS